MRDETMPIKIAAQPAERPHIVRRIGSAVLGVGVVLGLIAVIAVAIVPALSGAYALTVLSGSMEPTLPVGSVVVVRPTAPAQIAAGDVITFTDREAGSSATRVVTHRVVDVAQGPSGLTFGTRGDANDDVDVDRTAAADVLGKQWYTVPWIGSARDVVISPVGLCFLAGTLLLLVSAHLLLPRTQPTRRP